VSIWTQSEMDYVRQHYPHKPTRELAAELGRSVGSIYRLAAKLGIHKTPEFEASPASGRLKPGQTRPGMVATQFRPGQIPSNKGLRRPGYAPGRMSQTQFRAGNRTGQAALNWKPIGTILPDADGYLRIKVRDAVHGKEATGFGNTKVWPLLHRHTWIQHHGPIPDKHIVTLKDGDRSNCAIENLELISMADNARRNCMWNKYPRELAEVIQLGGALKRKLRNLDAKEQDLRST
jgi:hypothetical protein